MKPNKSFLILLFAAAFAACNSNETASGNDSDTVTTTGAGGTMMDTSTAMDTSAATMSTLSEDDREFMIDAAKGGLMEVEAGRMAQEKATSQKVKDLATMIVNDHTQANQELKSLASSKNVMLPDSLDRDKKEHLESMRKMGGKEFDKHYISMMKEDHREDINDFEKASNKASDADVKAFASKTLPVLRKHKDSVDAASKALK